ncbi:hypothetical protein D7Z54_04930 [Salibacterium salarium]|uniref:YqfQ-like protein n=1 Tax=Salibacterium salarium TaxID=284579 RepID=A0A428N7Y5_9BACI|nr:VrrA/YqfQ family protein [Salibacterium salarium]RSL34499.1 hypothetical protein D7Z54_04930 [Salibacterium salarium]
MLSLYPSSHPMPPASPVPPTPVDYGYSNHAMSFANPGGMVRNPSFGFAAPFVSQPSKLAALLPQIQRMVGVAQTVAPYVKQYYPLVRQLPALWSLLSSSSSFDGGSPSVKNDDVNVDTGELKTDAYYSESPPPKLYI